jgi:acyl-CoA synthetase (AMP-forming)/AMP-acid ligase II
MNIAHSLERAARHFAAKPAIVFEDVIITYQDLQAAVDRTAHGLTALGVTAGDRVALFLPNIPAFPITYLAVQKVGAIAVAVNTMLTSDELHHVLTDSGARTVFTTAALLPALGPLLGRDVTPERVVLCEGAAPGTGHPRLDDLGATADGAFRARDRDRDAPAAILYFSAAATMPLEVATRWRDTFGRPVHEGYGLTETSPFASYNHEWAYRPGSVGTPLEMVEMKVVDADDQEVAPGEWGEILIKGPNVMLGYWNRPYAPSSDIRDASARCRHRPRQFVDGSTVSRRHQRRIGYHGGRD